MEKRSSYFDNSSTTRIAPEVLDAMMPFLTEEYGNPGSLHWLGDNAAKAVRKARAQVSRAIGCYPSELFFTSGGTESDNIAIIGASENGKRIITSAIEHSAILETCEHMRSLGKDVTILSVDNEGMVDPDDLRKVMDDDVSVVSIMTANNVFGSIQRIRELSDIAHEFDAYFHTDAVQAFTRTDTYVKRSGADMLSISGHKIHGPKGIGALYVNNSVKIRPTMFGGGQELGLRPSTENVPGIVGMGEACELSMNGMDRDIKKMESMRNKIIDSVLEITGTALNGPTERRLCNNAHFRFDGVKGTDLVLKLSREGIATSTASACSAGSTEPSHVMTAIGLSAKQALSVLRISLSRYTTDEEVSHLLSVLPVVLNDISKE